MHRRGRADLPLHTGRAPRWLFHRMVRLARVIVEAVVGEMGADVFLQRLADPVWFQSLGSVLGFDWHSSGLTTTTTAALKEALRGLSIGIFAAGGKGGRARKTPETIRAVAWKTGLNPEPLIRASRMVARVDSVALQDGHTLYHHVMFFTPSGQWAVIQQGMNPAQRTARRYHWLSFHTRTFTEEPHTGIMAQKPQRHVLNFVARKARPAREAITVLTHDPPDQVVRIYQQALERRLHMPARHTLTERDIQPRYLHRILLSTYAHPPRDFETLLETPGLGPGTLRALALVADIVYGARPSMEDPALYSFAHGGKDGHPYPVNRSRYDRTVAIMEDALRRARMGRREKLEALRALSRWLEQETLWDNRRSR